MNQFAEAFVQKGLAEEIPETKQEPVISGPPRAMAEMEPPTITEVGDLGLVKFKISNDYLEWSKNPEGVEYCFMRVGVGGNFVAVHLYDAELVATETSKGRNILVHAKLMKKDFGPHHYIFVNLYEKESGEAQGVLKFHDLRFTPEENASDVKVRKTFEKAANAGALTIRTSK